MRRLLFVYWSLGAACHNSPSPAVDAAQTPPTANPEREVIDTGLVIDYTGMTGVATVTLGPSTSAGGSLEAEGLMIDGVTVDGAPILFTPGATLLLGLDPSDQPTPVVIAYHWMDHESFTGASAKGFTLDWPYYCGNIFPCHSQPGDG
ncbi:MAG TPA: hypothetical protein VFQ65_15430, partial [Kofleriaceae bacterium]|nr:hypothetical protein [Kofleriaceae bacterium]